MTTAVIEKNLIEDLNKQFGAFAEAMDNRMALVEKNLGTGEVDIRLAKINEAMDETSQRLERFQASTKDRVDHLETMQLQMGQIEGTASEHDKQASLFARQLIANNEGMPLDKVPEQDPQVFHRYTAAFTEYLRRGAISNALQIGGDPQGGFLVDPAMSMRIVRYLFETSPIRQIANVQTIGSDRLVGLADLDEAGFGWVGERTARTETATPQWDQWEIPVHEAYAEPRVTQNLLDDAGIDVASWLEMKVRDRLMRAENEATVVGDGVMKPRGFTTYGVTASDITRANWQNFQITKSGHATNVISDAAKLIALMGQLKAEYYMNAVWVMARRTLADIRQIKDTEGHFVFVPNFGASPYGEILGHPVRILEDMPATGTENNLFAGFGDWNACYQVVDRQMIRILRDPFTLKGYVKFYTTCRVGGDVVNFDAVKFLQQKA